MVDGKLLTHPKLEAGDRAKMKIYRVDPNEDILQPEIEEILSAALAIHGV